jgi:hypothetical protein
MKAGTRVEVRTPSNLEWHLSGMGTVLEPVTDDDERVLVEFDAKPDLAATSMMIASHKVYAVNPGLKVGDRVVTEPGLNSNGGVVAGGPGVVVAVHDWTAVVVYDETIGPNYGDRTWAWARDAYDLDDTCRGRWDEVTWDKVAAE